MVWEKKKGEILPGIHEEHFVDADDPIVATTGGAIPDFIDKVGFAIRGEEEEDEY